MKIKKGDTVLIIAGKDRGKTGVVEAILPRLNRIAITGMNKYRKHIKPSPKHTHGGIVELFRPIHVSNVMILDSGTKKPTRVGFEVKDTTKSRIARITGKTL